MTDASVRGRWLHEPLLHFLLIGAGIFILYHVVRGGDEAAPREIVISAPRIDALAENFARTWMRPPSPQELRGLVDDYVKEEVFYREAIAMGLDRDDTVIRRRLRQKMEFVSEDAAATAEPTDAQLQEFLAAHPGKFVEPARVTFQQVFVSAERRGESARRDAEQLLETLQAGRVPADAAAAGDQTLLPASLENAPPQEVAGSFGDEFAAQVDTVAVGQWAGPLQSSFGWHLVHVVSRTVSALPQFVDIRPVVLREWQAQQRLATGDAFYASLRAKYEVRYEGEVGQLLHQVESAAATGGRP